MVDIDKAVIARLKKQGENFEVLVDCNKAMDFRKGNATLQEALVTEEIYKDSKKGEHANEQLVAKHFGTTDPIKVAEQIIKQGDIQLTTEYKAKLRNERKKEIVSLIHRNAVDPKTNIPHPPQRIESAIDEIGVHIDEFKPAEEQIKQIVDKLRSILPISYELRTILLVIPAQSTGQCYSVLKQQSKIIKEEWQQDGSLKVTIEVPAGMQTDLFDKLNNITQGHLESKIISTT